MNLHAIHLKHSLPPPHGGKEVFRFSVADGYSLSAGGAWVFVRHGSHEMALPAVDVERAELCGEVEPTREAIAAALAASADDRIGYAFERMTKAEAERIANIRAAKEAWDRGKEEASGLRLSVGRVCVICREDIDSKPPGQKTCSRACGAKWRKQRNAET